MASESDSLRRLANRRETLKQGLKGVHFENSEFLLPLGLEQGSIQFIGN